MLHSPLFMYDNPAEVRVARSSAGLGLFADADIKKGDFIIEYTGERLTTEEADRRGGKYLFTYSDDIVIDGKERKNISRYANHSCAPNAEPLIDEEEEKIIIEALRNIKKGEEITYDYGKEYWLDHCQPCQCEKCQNDNKKDRS